MRSWMLVLLGPPLETVCLVPLRYAMLLLYSFIIENGHSMSQAFYWQIMIGRSSLATLDLGV